MPGVKDITEIMNRQLGINAESIYSVADAVEDTEKALKAGAFLIFNVVYAEKGLNPQFCEDGVYLLKRTYNKLCDKFPEITEKVHPMYNLKQH